MALLATKLSIQPGVGSFHDAPTIDGLTKVNGNYGALFYTNNFSAMHFVNV